MRVFGWVVAGLLVVVAGAVVGFAVSLFRPRHFSDYSTGRQAIT